MRKFSSAVVLAAALAGSLAYAGGPDENLRPLNAADSCLSPNIYFWEDGKEDEAFERELSNVLSEANLLYGKPFPFASNRSCTWVIVFSVDSFLSNDKSFYIYQMDFQVSFFKTGVSSVGTLSLEQRPYSATFSDAIIWSDGTFGTSPSGSTLRERSKTNAKRLFEKFVLAWRKTH